MTQSIYVVKSYCTWENDLGIFQKILSFVKKYKVWNFLFPILFFTFYFTGIRIQQKFYIIFCFQFINLRVWGKFRLECIYVVKD
jgi:hypothetical protein